MKNKYLGKGMVFYTESKNYDELTKNIAKLYPNATVELVPEDIEVPEFSLEEQIMLGLIDVSQAVTISYSTDVIKNDIQSNKLDYVGYLAA